MRTNGLFTIYSSHHIKPKKQSFVCQHQNGPFMLYSLDVLAGALAAQQEVENAFVD
jgi:hypothetical protein